MEAATSDRPAVDFLKRRFASAIRCGDGPTASRLRVELDRLINGAPAPALRAAELPPAAWRATASSAGSATIRCRPGSTPA